MDEVGLRSEFAQDKNHNTETNLQTPRESRKIYAPMYHSLIPKPYTIMKYLTESPALTLTVQVFNNHILTPNPYYNYSQVPHHQVLESLGPQAFNPVYPFTNAKAIQIIIPMILTVSVLMLIKTRIQGWGRGGLTKGAGVTRTLWNHCEMDILCAALL